MRLEADSFRLTLAPADLAAAAATLPAGDGPALLLAPSCWGRGFRRHGDGWSHCERAQYDR